MSDPVTVEDLISQMTTTATELQRAQVTVNTAETTIVAKAAQIAAAADTIAAIGPASTSEAGTVQLSNAVDSTDETLAATPKAVKTAYDLAESKYTAQDASTTQKGIVKLNSSVTSTSTSEAATASAVKQAYDLANTANTAAASKYTAQDASTTAKGVVQLSNETNVNSDSLAATASAVKAVYDLANGKSTVSFTQTLTSGTEIGTITINGQPTTLYCEVGGGSNVNVVEVPTISGPSTGPIGYNVTFSLSAEALLSGATIASFTYGWQGSATSTATATSNAASVTLTVPASTTAGSNLTLVVTATDSLGNVSQEASKVVQAVNAYVNKPSVTAPANGASIAVIGGLTVTLSSFGSTGVTDTYSSSSFYIYSNSACTNVVASKVNYNGTSYTFTSSELSSLSMGNTYYVKGSHKGATLGESSLSDAVSFTVPTKSSLNDMTWAQIKSISQAGTGDTYFDVGDSKTITLNGTVGTLALNGSYKVTIVHFNYRNESGIIFQGFKDVNDNDIAFRDEKGGNTSTDGTKYFNMNHWGNLNHGGWKGCDLRYDILGSTDKAPSGYGAAVASGRTGYDATAAAKTSPVANTLMAALPSDLRNVLQPWTIYTDNTGGASNIEANVTTSIDYLPLLAEFEVFGSRNNANQYEQNTQEQMAYYANGNSKIRRHQDTLSAVAWWLRSPGYDGSYGFRGVNGFGSSGDSGADFSVGLAPAFKI